MKKLLAILLAAALCIAGCSAPREQIDPAQQRDSFLQRVEEIRQYEDEKLLNAATQMEINEISGILYEKWNALLDEVQQYLQTVLSAEEFAALDTDAWLAEREQAVEAAGAELRGGSAEPMARAMAGVRCTEERVDALIAMITPEA